jgi:hypothetical protein
MVNGGAVSKKNPLREGGVFVDCCLDYQPPL